MIFQRQSKSNLAHRTEQLKGFLSGVECVGNHINGDGLRFSIVMPSYNQAKYIERSILSVLGQGYGNLELIVIDGGSTDGTVEVIKRYEKFITYWHSGPDRGQSDALNHGFSKATGDVFGWLNSDDLYFPSAIKRVHNVFCSGRRPSVVYGDWLSIDAYDRVFSENYSFDFSLGQFIYEGFHLNSQAMFWTREAHQRFGEFDVRLHRTMDYDLIVRLGLNEGEKSFYRIPYPLACFRRHEEQKTREHEKNSELGFDPMVLSEHKYIATKSGFPDKFTRIGEIKRLAYRLRRAYWYMKRGGIGYRY